MRNIEKQTKVESGVKWSKYWQTMMSYKTAVIPPNSRGNDVQCKNNG
jgi:hypothetical protein